jgi:peptidoglycan/xylan/chitin deacetylase (PgdA/CDA1 family)
MHTFNVKHLFVLFLFFVFSRPLFAQSGKNNHTNFTINHGAIIRGDSTQKKIALVFTGDEFADGANYISEVLKDNHIHASFFLTGNFYRNKTFKKVIAKLKKNGNYLGSHSDKHLLYSPWENRDSLLVSKEEFNTDLLNSYKELNRLGIKKSQAHYFLPPYEYYNDSIASWTTQLNLQLINFAPGTRSNADYTYPEMEKRYISSKEIYNSILHFEENKPNGLNGFILLIHIGTDARRTDKFYKYLPKLIPELKARGYQFQRISELLQ